MKSIKIRSLVTVLCIATHFTGCSQESKTNQVAEAISNLKNASNYSWTCRTKSAGSQTYRPFSEGQIAKGGFAKIGFFAGEGEHTHEYVLKGNKIARYSEGGMMLTRPLHNGDVLAGMVGNGGFSTANGLFTKVEPGWELLDQDKAESYRKRVPTQEAETALKNVKEIKALDDGALGGDFTSDYATQRLTPRRSSSEKPLPAPKEAKGWVKFWIKDGLLEKYETHVHCILTIEDKDREFDVNSAVDIKDVGITKMDIPADAREKLEAK